MNGSSLPALPAVYSFLFPEVADVIRRFDAAFDPDLLRVGTPAASLTAWIREHVSGSLVAPSMTRIPRAPVVRSLASRWTMPSELPEVG